MTEDSTIKIIGGPKNIAYTRIGDATGLVVIVLGNDIEKAKRAAMTATQAVWNSLDEDERPTSDKWKMPDGPRVVAERGYAPGAETLHYCHAGALTACGKRRETVWYTDGSSGTVHMDEAVARGSACPTCRVAMGVAATPPAP